MENNKVTKFLNFDPDCFKKLSEKETHKILDVCRKLVSNSTKVFEELEELKPYLNSKDLDCQVDYDNLIDLEDYLDYIPVEKVDYDADKNEFMNCYYRAIDYFNTACDILGRDTCTNTVRDCLEMRIALEGCLGNMGSAYSSAFWDAIRFFNFRKLLSKGNTELALETYPDMDAETTININRVFESWLSRNKFSIEDMCKITAQLMNTYQNVTDLAYIHRDKFDKFRDILNDSSEDFQVEDYLDYVLLQDIDCFITGTILLDNNYVLRLKKRAGDDKVGVQYSQELLNILSMMYLISPESYEFLYKYEPYIIENKDWCLNVIQANAITPKLKSMIMSESEEDSELLNTKFFE